MSAELTGDLDFIKDVRQWPAYPFLAMKRAGMTELLDGNFGIVVANENIPVPVVFITTIFDINEKTDFNKVKKIAYNSVEELLMEWVID